MEWDISEIPTANPSFSTMTDSLATLPSLPDISRLPEFKMADYKPEVDCMLGMEWVISQIPTANPTFSTMTYALTTLLTLPDVDRLPEFKMADCKPEVDCISGMEWAISEITTANPENVGAAVGIQSIYHSIPQMQYTSGSVPYFELI